MFFCFFLIGAFLALDLISEMALRVPPTLVLSPSAQQTHALLCLHGVGFLMMYKWL